MINTTFITGALVGWSLGFAVRIAYLKWDHKKQKKEGLKMLQEYEKERAEAIARKIASWPVVKSGRHAGKPFDVINTLEGMGGYDGAKTLQDFADRGNVAASLAVYKDKYTEADAPFYYGKIMGEDGTSSYGHIISHKDLYGAKDQ